jgi:hypothetical protein
MSPAGGVGINLAIQDAVAAANLLARPLREGRVTEELLARVQKRRMFPTRVTQRMQVNAHKGLQYVFEHSGPLKAPWQLKAAVRVPGLQSVLGRLVGVGVRPEHIEPEGEGARLPIFNRPSIKRLAVCTGVATALAVIATCIVRSTRTAS